MVAFAAPMSEGTNKPQEKRGSDRPKRPLVSAVLSTGTIVELIYEPVEQHTALAVWHDGAWRSEHTVVSEGGERCVPYSPRNNLIRHQVVRFPSAPEEYGSEEALLRDIRHFIHRYVDVSTQFERIASYYVLLSWVYDGFAELPYLRVRGDYGSGKTRFLLTVGAICYKPIYASGASTVSPLFHLLDTFRGTLIIDEADFRFSDERSEIAKILNNGNVKGFPVLRTEMNNNREFNPRAFDVFGPKIVATRGDYQDAGLESRFITEDMGQRRLREDVPISLPKSHKDEAQGLRNKLLLFRFRNLGRKVPDGSLIDRSIEPRLNQIFAPLLTIIEDPELRKELRVLARQYNRDMIADRGLGLEGQLLEVIKPLMAEHGKSPSVKDIAEAFQARYGEEYQQQTITPKWIGAVLRKKLHLRTHKSGSGAFVIPFTETPKLERLYERYGITDMTDMTEVNLTGETADARQNQAPTRHA